ncbi:hypothetical protein AWB71_05280 [Caballeronia peredens]|nr:hypothetical protein AWB71_05280 [Caballeronia peredens]
MKTRIRIGDLDRAIKEEFFNLHAWFVDPECSERDFYNKSVKLVKLDLRKLGREDLMNLKPEQVKQYMQVVKAGDRYLPAVADGNLVDGMHRISAMRLSGKKECLALDFTGLIDTAQSGYQIDVKVLKLSQELAI